MHNDKIIAQLSLSKNLETIKNILFYTKTIEENIYKLLFATCLHIL